MKRLVLLGLDDICDVCFHACHESEKDKCPFFVESNAGPLLEELQEVLDDPELVCSDGLKIVNLEAELKKVVNDDRK